MTAFCRLQGTLQSVLCCFPLDKVPVPFFMKDLFDLPK